ncbi:MAG: hypothetical protein KDD77_01725 [Caldilineaceae bacterium]|nr:hypothetical protein [Rhodocyclaceae bacterium]MCB0065836.1 hypothetical protein [Caldilineaceae bacterium]
MIALYVLVLALLWLGVGALARKLWSTNFVPERGISRRVRIFGGWGLLMGWLFVPWYLLYGRTALLDAEVRELCAKDGGVKVYETVKLPAEKFDKWGNVRIPSKRDAALTDEYYYEIDTTYFRTGNPEVWRSRYWVTRRGDGKVLGESIRYARRGGDIPGPWHPSSFGCPDVTTQPGIEKSIFMKEAFK